MSCCSARGHARFDAEDQLRHVAHVAARDPATAQLLLADKVLALTGLYFDVRGVWTPPPEQRLAQLPPAIAALVGTFAAPTPSHQLALADQLVARYSPPSAEPSGHPEYDGRVPVSSERLLSVIELQNAIAAAGMNADEVMGIVVERASTLTAATGAVVALVEGDEIVYRAVSRPSTIAVGTRLSKTTSLPGRCVADRTPIKIDDTTADDRIDAETRTRLGAGSLACVPLLYGEAAVGVLEVVAVKQHAFSDEDIEILRLLAQVIAIALHRAYTYPKPRYDSATDALTGLGNKRAFDERIQAELTRNRRYGHSFSLALLDLNGVESSIDRFGQAAGDDALREVARILQKHTRAIDAGFRVAADDFAIVMPGTSAEGARIVAERCRAHIREARLCEGGVTTSIGVVEAGDETADDLAGRAAASVLADKATRRAGTNS